MALTKEGDDMKKCNICGNETKEDERICPKCGHDFCFVYKKDNNEFKRRFYTKADFNSIDRRALIILFGAIIDFIIALLVISFLI